MKPTPLRLVRIAVLLGVTGCALAPYDDQGVDQLRPIPVNGYASKARATVVVSALNVETNRYEEVGRITAASTPEIRANTWPNTPDLFKWSGAVSLQYRHWTSWMSRGCVAERHPTPRPDGIGAHTEPSACLPSGDAELLFEEPGSNMRDLATFPAGGVSCMLDHLNRLHEDMIAALNACSTGEPGIVHVHAASCCYL
ncbi:MAG TPA: hypothetical protein PKA64_12015 [Myxococcota bacterium]|nr:hypothetical protein [Myxococcota bacterium]